ncbi:MAG TPA: response regulator [Caldilineaceae bacterium]|nr:response regulator [Caldilineaceae bacterium]
MNEDTLHILLVEDDDVDAEAVVRAFKKEQLNYPFTIVTNGLEALTLLRGENWGASGRYARPHIILLDLNMPRMNGIEFLQELRADERLKDSIVFVLTTSNRDEDKWAAYGKQVAGYILKTRAGKDFADMVTLVKCYETIVEFPPNKGKRL